MRKGLLIQRVQHCMPGAIRRSAGALRSTFAETRCHTAKRSLIDATVLSARKRHAIVLKLDNGVGRFLAHVLDSILIAEPVRAFDGVVHVPAPIVFAHVS